MKPRIIAVVGTGGTIAGCAQNPGDALNYRAAVRPVQDLLAGLALPPGLAIEAQQLAQIDSKDVTEAHWRALLQAVQHQLQLLKKKQNSMLFLLMVVLQKST